MNSLRIGSLSIFFLVACLVGSPAVQAKTDANAGIMPQASADCTPGTGWRWVDGPEQPQAASQAQDALARAGVSAKVTAFGYGEMDLCDTYVARGVDLFISLAQDPQLEQFAQAEIEWKIQKALQDLPGVSIGNVKVSLPHGETLTLHLNEPAAAQPLAAGLSTNTTWKQVDTPQRPSARMAQGMAFDSLRGKTVLFGGDNTGSGRLNDTWEYDGASWTQKSPAHAPEGRVNIDQAMTFDTWRSTMVLFGGLGTSQYFNDTWEYNGVDWSMITTSQIPAARDSNAMAFDSQRGKTVLFGGYTYAGVANDTWEYDGDWHLISLASQPPARSHHAMVYDTRRKVVVLFGGSVGPGLGALNDTWEYDGLHWTQVSTPQSPPARQNHGMAYDAERGVVVLFGGANNGVLKNDTWEYDGSSWVQVAAAQKPSAREELSLVFDAIREKVVLFGGGSWVGGYHPTNETWEYPFADSYDGVVINKKVYVIAYNPFVDVGKTKRLWDYFGWNSYEDITQGTIDFFRGSSGGQIRYSVVDTTVLDEIPEKTDGFIYSVDDYIKVIQHTAAAHSPDGVNYNLIVNDPRLDICGKANRGEIDEVWVFNGPYYGFWESTLVGPGSYWYNSPPVPGPFTCNRMIPIMGPNPERYVSEHVEDFGHRTESTMRKVYKDQWEQNQTRNGWEKFALVASLSPGYTYSGCGNVHFPPNGQRDYDWGNPLNAQTYCDDFANYPNLHDPTQVLKTVSCSTWGCDGLDYFNWWYSHYPRNAGCGPDAVANNWWIYFANPELALNPVKGCALNFVQHVYLPTIRR